MMKSDRSRIKYIIAAKLQEEEEDDIEIINEITETVGLSKVDRSSRIDNIKR
jgi:hypothetical protein